MMSSSMGEVEEPERGTDVESVMSSSMGEVKEPERGTDVESVENPGVKIGYIGEHNFRFICPEGTERCTVKCYHSEDWFWVQLTGPKDDGMQEKETQSQRGIQRSEKPNLTLPPPKRPRTEASTSQASQSSQAHKAHEVPSTFNLKLSSWNVNGIRSWIEKNGLQFLNREAPDIFCLQKTKCPEDKLPDEVQIIEGYHSYWTVNCDTARYSGVGLMSKQKPINVTYGIGVEEYDVEGRVITAEYQDFYVVTAYVPYSGIVGLAYRIQWDIHFFTYLRSLLQQKQVILCGDLNVAHQQIDVANPIANRRSAGFTEEERESFGLLLDSGFTDTFRYLYPNITSVYSFWAYLKNARSRNDGWRLDYFLCSEGLKTKVHDSIIHTEVMGSNHCPVSLLLQI